jgi:DNA-binding phage protein
MAKRIPLTTLHDTNGAARRMTILDTAESIASVAKTTGYSRAHLSRIFRRLEGPSPACLTAIARALGKSPDALAPLLKAPRRRALRWPADD